MTAHMQTVREMARTAGVSERLMAQGLHVVRKGIPGIISLVWSHRTSLPELTLMVDQLSHAEQVEWSLMSEDELKAALAQLRKSKTAQMRVPVLEGLHSLAAGTLGVQDFLARYKGARIPNGDV